MIDGHRDGTCRVADRVPEWDFFGGVAAKHPWTKSNDADAARKNH
jgi:hypothetical protein